MAGLLEEKRAAARELIRRAALEVFAEKGFTATTAADIAQRAGISERTFFRYFTAKEDVVLQPLAELRHRYQVLLTEQPKDASPLDVVRGALMIFLEEAIDEDGPAWTKAASLVGVDPALILIHVQRSYEEMATVIAEEVARRTGLAPGDAYPRTVGWVSVGVLRAYSADPSAVSDLPRLYNEAFDVVAAGLPAPKASRRRKTA